MPNPPGPPPPRRSIRPRRETRLDKPVIAIHGDSILLENGDVHPTSELPELIVTQPSSIIVTHQPGHIVRDLDTHFTDHPRWQFRATPIERELWGANRKYRTTIRDTTISFFGFQGENKKAGHYHYPISPQTFCLLTANAIRRAVDPPETSTLVHLMRWGLDIRNFLQSHKLDLRPTSGGVAGQLLRDKRFYPEDRRKVPRYTNAAARDQLPGNFYRLYSGEVGRVYRAAYLDQTAAHHSAAKDIEFPDADTLKMRGRFNSLDIHRPFCKSSSPNFRELISQPGLFYLGVATPHLPDKSFPLPGVEGMGFHAVYAYSNELPYLRKLGVDIRFIVAQWTSPNLDRGLNRYAEWALDQIQVAPPERKPWLKPALLSTYGVLAARPKKIEFGYKRAKNATEKQYPCGSGFLTVQAKRTEQIREMPTANVIHRGMIEAETRLRTLQMASDLSALGHPILGVYADSVFVENGAELPLLPAPWRLQEHLTGLRFMSATQFRSDQVSKLPGMSLAERERARLPPRPKRRKTRV